MLTELFCFTMVVGIGLTVDHIFLVFVGYLFMLKKKVI